MNKDLIIVVGSFLATVAIIITLLYLHTCGVIE